MNHFDTVLAFGDSFSAQCGTLWNAETNALEVDRLTWTDFKSGLWGNSIFDDCSANEGMNYLNYLTGCTQNGIDPLTCPIRLIDLAFGGAQAGAQPDTDTSIIHGQAEQMLSWAQHVKPNLNFDADKTLVSIFYGLNDLTIMHEEGFSDILAQGTVETVELEISRRLAFIESSMGILYDDGLRNFLILNVPLDIGDADALILGWNRLLDSRMHSFEKQKSDVKVYMMDTYALSKKIMDAPHEYGLDDVDHACFSERFADSHIDCSGTSTFLKMDWIHWTPKAHVLIAEAVEEMLATQIDAKGHSIVHEASSAIDVTLYKIKSTVMDNSLAAIAILTGVSVIGLFSLLYRFYRRLNGKISAKQPQTASSRYIPVPATDTEGDIELQNTNADFEIGDEET